MITEKMTCQELVKLVTDYFEGTLSEDVRVRFETHLAGCLGCRTYVDQMWRTIRALGKLSDEEPSPQTEEEVLQLFRRWKQERDQPAPE